MTRTFRLSLLVVAALAGCNHTTVVYYDSGGANTEDLAMGTTGGEQDLAMGTTGGGADMMCRGQSKLFPPMMTTGATVYCPFATGNKYCDPSTEHCCETAAGATMPSMCEPIATACIAGSVDWGCADPTADCRDNTKPVCCAAGASIGVDPCAGNFAHHMTGTACVATGGCAGGIIMCTSDAQCPAGQTCTPFRKAGNQVGGCM
jgi:hypothetical protein